MLLDQFAHKLCTHLLNAALKHFALALLRRGEGTEYTGRRIQSTVLPDPGQLQRDPIR